MYKKTLILLSILVVAALVVPFGVHSASAYSGVPTISIMEVTKGPTVSIQMDNFPDDTDFVVTMAPYGNYGVNGTVVETINSGKGGKNSKTFLVPDSLRNESTIAIRLENSEKGYFAFNWFINPDAGMYPVSSVTPTTSAATPVPAGTATPAGAAVVPSFLITSVTADQSVTIQTAGFPSGQDYTVRMGKYGTAGLNGTIITKTSSGSGGVIVATYNIPTDLKGQAVIAIRLENQKTGDYLYGWFNNTTNYSVSTPAVQSTPSTTSTSGTATPIAYNPVITIAGVVAGSKVTVEVAGVPAGETLTVLLGKYGTNGVGGTEVGKLDSVTKSGTFTIPTDLAALDRIALRVQSATGENYSYSWFYNVTTNP